MPGSIPLPQITFGKHKENSQMCHVSTTDGRLLIEEIPVIANCMMSDKHSCLFIMDDSEQYQGKDGSFYQLLSDKSKVPLMPACEELKKKEKAKQLESMDNDIFDLTEDMKTFEQFVKGKRNEYGEIIKWCVTIAFSAFTILGVIAYLKG